MVWFYLLVFILVPLAITFFPRKCKSCNLRMKLRLTKKREIIYECGSCGNIRKTGFYGGAND